MDMLSKVIKCLNKEELRYLKLFLKRTNARDDRKDVQLLDYIRKYPNRDLEQLSKKLYGDNKNAFYRLKNRLLEDINKSLLSLHYDVSHPNHSFTYLSLSRHFFHKNAFDLAFRYLKKAEKIAEKSNQYEVLDIIYTDYIRLSHETLEVDPESYIQKRKELASRINKIREIDDLLAVLIYRIKRSQNYASGDEEVLTILRRTIDDYSNSEDLDNSPVLRFKIYHAVSRMLLQQMDYVSLETYLEETYESFEKLKLFDKNNHDTKLQMLTYWTNSLFKNNKHVESLKVAEKLHGEMQRFEKGHRDKYYFFYVNAQIINYSILDPRKALSIADQALEEAVIRQNSIHRIFVLLNKAQLLFDTGNYKSANRSIIQLKLDDAYQKLDTAFQLKISVAEIIIRFESNDFDSVEVLISNFRKDYKESIASGQFERQVAVLKIMEGLMVSHDLKKNKPLLEMVHQVINELDDARANEIDLINYHRWLKGKV